MLVEVCSDGTWFVRQLNVTRNGVLQDLNILIDAGKIISRNAKVEAINWGDIHVGEVPEDVAEASWGGKDSMLSVLKPKYQFLHDTLDFKSRNHHDIGNHLRNFQKHINGVDTVEEEIGEVAKFINTVSRKGIKTVVVNSNHDDALNKWLNIADYKTDPKNALFFLEAQHKRYLAIKEKDAGFFLIAK